MAADGALPAVVGARSDAKASTAVRSAAARRWRSVGLFVAYAMPFVVAAVCYEVLRHAVHYRGDVHVGDLFDLEARLFPITTQSGTVALSDVISRMQHPLLDVVCGATYLFFLLELFGVAIYAFFRDRPRMLALSLGFLFLNLTGWTIWMLYPAAPPWYVDLHGKGPAILSTPSNPAGLVRLDELLGIPIARTFYAGSADVFGAMPSLHVAYAILVAWVSFPMRGALRVFTLVFAASIAFSAVYLRHHYILDVIAGVALALPVSWFSVWCALRLHRRLQWWSS